MKIFLPNKNVWDMAVERMNRLFDEFDNVVICNSGGKDSTVTMQVCLHVAEQRGRLPVKMLFVDQECEYRNVIEYMRDAMADKRVEPLWLQCPIKITNSLSQDEPWLYSWEHGAEWMREKEPNSIGENIFGVETWSSGVNGIFAAVLEKYFPNEKACFVAGVRAEESPTRLAGLTTGSTYKDITWGKILNKKIDHYTFYPIWDWSLSDVWKAIHDNNWNYCKIYDELYRYGIPPHRMRVSSLNHETAVHSLFFLQEIEKDTWDALVKRSAGINQAAHIGKQEMMATTTLPFMFKNWQEYRDYLTENLITIDEHRARFVERWKKMDDVYSEMAHPEDVFKAQIRSVLVNDYEFVKLSNFMNSPALITYRQWRKGELGARTRSKDLLKYIKPQYQKDASL